jgi:hypothetical protein
VTPKEKAEDLFVTFYQRYDDSIYSNEGAKTEAKFCALICVDEVLNHHSQEQGLYRIDRYYWQEVKNELDKL